LAAELKRSPDRLAVAVGVVEIKERRGGRRGEKRGKTERKGREKRKGELRIHRSF